MNKKKVILGIILILVLIGLIIGCWCLSKKSTDETKTEENKKETITISFDTDGGTEVASITTEKGSKITLPTTVKDGYNFLGWTNEDKEVTEETTFEKDTTLKAVWEKIKKDAKTMKVSFDTKGGNKIKSVTMECGKPLSLPSNPTKEGYKFLNWTDKKGKKVSKGDTLACANITLYAKWEDASTYSCPDDYDIDADHKCTKKVAAKEKCDGERSYEYEGKCITITAAARKDYDKACKQEHVTYMSFAGYVDGKVVNWGRWGCAYYKTNDTTQDACSSHGFTWVTPEKACYVKWAGGATINSCKDGYADISNPNSYSGVNGMNGGCFPIKEKTKYCDSDYKLEGSYCIKQIDATKN